MKKQKSQMQMFWEADRHVADANEAFFWLVEHGLTREDLARNIERRPLLWERFSNWLDKLPSANNKQHDSGSDTG